MNLFKIFYVVLVSSVVLVLGEFDFQNSSIRAVLRVYDDCQKADSGLSMCIKKKAITLVDRISNLDIISVGDGVKVVRTDQTSDQKQPVITDSELEKSLPRGLEARNEALTKILLDKMAQFVNGRTIKITLPQMSSDEIGRAIEEGRGKMKKMMGMMMMGFAMKMAAMVPVAIAGLYLLAGKALIISKIALLLASIIGIKKLLASKPSTSSGHSSGWSTGGSGGGGWQSGGGGGGGWERRSLDGQTLAYKAYTLSE